MKCTALLGLCLMVILPGLAQDLRLKDLSNLLDLNQKKLENHILKKGFKRTGAFEDEGSGLSLVRHDLKPEPITRCFQVLPNSNGFDLLYKTTSQKEYSQLQNELIASGFSFTSKAGRGTNYYQKRELELICQPSELDTCTFYTVRTNRKSIPRLKEIVFAEDLLQFDSHNYLVEVFGRENVKKDSFYFTDTESTRCSIIFPNTSHQAIFIWKDAASMRDISFVLFGDHTAHSALSPASMVLLSSWRSKQGVFCGMSLKELQVINREPVNFFNWRSELAGNMAPGNTGSIDFQKLKILFGCLNCGYLNINEKTEIIGSEKALAEDQKVYVTSFFILPGK